MTIHYLQNIFEKSINGEWGNEDSGNGEATAVIRTSNFLNSGRLNLDNIVCRDIDKNKNSDKILRTGDIIIEKSGGSPNQPVGRVVYFDVTDQDYFTNNFTSILRVKPGYNSKYIFYLMKYLYDTKKVLKFQNQTTGIINLKLTDYLNKTKVNIETIENQNTIVDILDRLEYQIINRNKQLSELSNLVKSRFNELFGDLFLNEFKWDYASFNEFAKFDTKMIYDFTNFIDLPHIGIDSIEKNTGKLIGYRTVGEDQISSGKYLFTKKHIIYSKIRPNLNKVALPDFMGVCSADAYPILTIEEKMNRIFLAHVLRSDYFLNFILSFSSRTNLPKVNKSQISKFKCPLPPLSLQNEFADFVAQVDKSQFACQKAIKLWRNSLKSSII